MEVIKNDMSEQKTNLAKRLEQRKLTLHKKKAKTSLQINVDIAEDKRNLSALNLSNIMGDTNMQISMD